MATCYKKKPISLSWIRFPLRPFRALRLPARRALVTLFHRDDIRLDEQDAKEHVRAFRRLRVTYLATAATAYQLNT